VPRELKFDAWWCECCAKAKGNYCTAEVPYYCSSPHCAYWTEHEPEPIKPVKHTLKWYKKHVLVDTI
jgi:hypothetical protein